VALVQFHVTTAGLPHAGAGPKEALHDGAGTQETVAVVAVVAPPAPTALMVQRSPAAPTARGSEPAHGTAPLDGVVPVQTWVHDVALVQFHVTTAAAPHAGAGPKEALQAGGPPVAMQETVAVAVPVEPSLPSALMVQVSPAAPTVYGPEPEHGTGPLDGVVPVQTWVHDVASAQLHVKTEVPPHAGAGPNDPVHIGRERQVVVVVAVAVVPLLPDALMVQVSPPAPTTREVEPVQATTPLEGVEPVQV